MAFPQHNLLINTCFYAHLIVLITTIQIITTGLGKNWILAKILLLVILL